MSLVSSVTDFCVVSSLARIQSTYQSTNVFQKVVWSRILSATLPAFTSAAILGHLATACVILPFAASEMCVNRVRPGFMAVPLNMHTVNSHLQMAFRCILTLLLDIPRIVISPDKATAYYVQRGVVVPSAPLSRDIRIGLGVSGMAVVGLLILGTWAHFRSAPVAARHEVSTEQALERAGPLPSASDPIGSPPPAFTPRLSLPAPAPKPVIKAMALDESNLTTIFEAFTCPAPSVPDRQTLPSSSSITQQAVVVDHMAMNIWPLITGTMGLITVMGGCVGLTRWRTDARRLPLQNSVAGPAYVPTPLIVSNPRPLSPPLPEITKPYQFENSRCRTLALEHIAALLDHPADDLDEWKQKVEELDRLATQLRVECFGNRGHTLKVVNSKSSVVDDIKWDLLELAQNIRDWPREIALIADTPIQPARFCPDRLEAILWYFTQVLYSPRCSGDTYDRVNKVIEPIQQLLAARGLQPIPLPPIYQDMHYKAGEVVLRALQSLMQSVKELQGPLPVPPNADLPITWPTIDLSPNDTPQEKKEKIVIFMQASQAWEPQSRDQMLMWNLEHERALEAYDSLFHPYIPNQTVNADINDWLRRIQLMRASYLRKAKVDFSSPYAYAGLTRRYADLHAFIQRQDALQPTVAFPIYLSNPESREEYLLTCASYIRDAIRALHSGNARSTLLFQHPIANLSDRDDVSYVADRIKNLLQWVKPDGNIVRAMEANPVELEQLPSWLALCLQKSGRKRDAIPEFPVNNGFRAARENYLQSVKQFVENTIDPDARMNAIIRVAEILDIPLPEGLTDEYIDLLLDRLMTREPERLPRWVSDAQENKSRSP